MTDYAEVTKICERDNLTSWHNIPTRVGNQDSVKRYGNGNTKHRIALIVDSEIANRRTYQRVLVASYLPMCLVDISNVNIINGLYLRAQEMRTRAPNLS